MTYKIPLTDRQRQIYDFIWEHIERKGYPPTYGELAAGLRIKSVNSMVGHLAALRKKGWIEVGSKTPRAIRLVGVAVKLVAIGADEEE